MKTWNQNRTIFFGTVLFGIPKSMVGSVGIGPKPNSVGLHNFGPKLKPNRNKMWQIYKVEDSLPISQL